MPGSWGVCVCVSVSGVTLRQPGGLWQRGSNGCEGASSPSKADGLGCRGQGCSVGGREVLASASKPSKQKNVVLQRATGCHEQGGSQHGHGMLLSPASLASLAAPSLLPSNVSSSGLEQRYPPSLEVWQISYLLPLLNAQKCSVPNAQAGNRLKYPFLCRLLEGWVSLGESRLPGRDGCDGEPLPWACG